MTKRLIIAIALLVLFSTYKLQNFFFDTKLNIKEIIIENNNVLKDSEIKKDLTPIYNTNLLFLNVNYIKEILVKQNFIKSYEIKKIYPNKLKIKIFEKKPIAILQYKKEKFYFTENKNLIDYRNLEEYKNLPIVFGNRENFEKLYKVLKKNNFSIKQIKKFYYFNSDRWDLLTIKDQMIKLPINDYISSLENFINLRDNNNFEKYKIFDYRINNQLILK
jgi:cell division protein FtsQ